MVERPAGCGRSQSLSPPSALCPWRQAPSRNGRGIHGIARPNLFPVLIEDDPFAVADAMRAGEDFGMAVRTVQRKGRVRRGPVIATR